MVKVPSSASLLKGREENKRYKYEEEKDAPEPIRFKVYHPSLEFPNFE
jgi:hypothetical protein